MSFDPTTIALLILCPLAWAAFDFARKRMADLGRAAPVTLVVALVQLPVVAVWVASDLLARPDGAPSAGYGWPATGALAIGVVGTLAFQQAIRLSPLSATVPLLSLTPAFSSVLGLVLLDEVPTSRQWTGVALVVVGALLVNAGDRFGLPDLIRGLIHEPGSPFMIVAALLFAAAPLFDKQALRFASLPFHVTFVITGVVIVLGGQLLATGRLGELRPFFARPRLLLTAGAISLLAFAFQLAAVQRVWVGLLETAKRAVGSAAALALGALVLGESVRPSRWAAVSLMAIGVALVVA